MIFKKGTIYSFNYWWNLLSFRCWLNIEMPRGLACFLLSLETSKKIGNERPLLTFLLLLLFRPFLIETRIFAALSPLPWLCSNSNSNLLSFFRRRFGHSSSLKKFSLKLTVGTKREIKNVPIKPFSASFSPRCSVSYPVVVLWSTLHWQSSHPFYTPVVLWFVIR